MHVQLSVLFIYENVYACFFAYMYVYNIPIVVIGLYVFKNTDPYMYANRHTYMCNMQGSSGTYACQHAHVCMCEYMHLDMYMQVGICVVVPLRQFQLTKLIVIPSLSGLIRLIMARI